MKIGFLYEGDNDEKALAQIIKKIILTVKPHLNKSDIKLIPKCGNGNIEGHMEPAATLFKVFNCDISVYVSDVDSGVKAGKAKCARIKRNLKKIIAQADPSARCISAFPNPELEQWFFQETDAIKTVLRISDTQLTQRPDLAPKERFKFFIKKHNRDITMTNRDVYEKVAERLDLEKLKEKDGSFATFYDALVKLTGEL